MFASRKVDGIEGCSPNEVGTAPALVRGRKRSIRQKEKKAGPGYRPRLICPRTWMAGYFNFADGSPNRIQDLRMSGSAIAAFARMIASPKVTPPVFEALPNSWR
jgi:hypothetical protein